MVKKYKNKIFVIIGKSASGKDTILNKLIEKYNYKKIVPYTTRAPRKYEVNGDDYNFVSEEEFLKMVSNGDLIEFRSFNTVNGKVLYGTHKDIYKMLKDDNVFCILSPERLNEFIKIFGNETIVPIYIKQRAFNRIYNSFKRVVRDSFTLSLATEEQAYEICRRFIQDKHDFENIEVQDIFVVRNYSSKEMISLLCEKIKDYVDKKDYKYLKL